ncbi:MAG: hypothetical protein ACFCD0_25690 [Gemmataceae bacterium]
MFYIVGTVLLMGLIIGVVLAIGTLIIQSTFYTEPTSGVLWQAPATAGGITVFLLLWCFFNVWGSGTRQDYVPYPTIFGFPASVDLTEEPLPGFWSVKGTGSSNLVQDENGKWVYAEGSGDTQKTKYVLKKKVEVSGNLVTSYYVEENNPSRPWNPAKVVAIIIEYEDREIRFQRTETDSEDAFAFVSDDGWTMRMYRNGGATTPFRFPTGLFLVCLFLNTFHLGLWFTGLWLVLRFQWFHALLISLAFWVPVTLIALPGLLGEAAKLGAS